MTLGSYTMWVRENYLSITTEEQRQKWCKRLRDSGCRGQVVQTAMSRAKLTEFATRVAMILEKRL